MLRTKTKRCGDACPYAVCQVSARDEIELPNAAARGRRNFGMLM